MEIVTPVPLIFLNVIMLPSVDVLTNYRFGDIARHSRLAIGGIDPRVHG